VLCSGRTKSLTNLSLKGNDDFDGGEEPKAKKNLENIALYIPKSRQPPELLEARGKQDISKRNKRPQCSVERTFYKKKKKKSNRGEKTSSKHTGNQLFGEGVESLISP